MLVAALTAAALTAVAVGGAPPAPLPWQEPAPLARMFLQPALEAPEVPPAGILRGEVRLLYDDALLVDRNAALAVEIHEETAQLTAVLGWVPAAGLELQAAVPVLLDIGGFLDGPIARVEGWFNAENPNAIGRPRDVAVYRLQDASGRGIARNGTEAGMGDPRLAVRWAVREADGALPALTLRLTGKLPLGRPPFGSGHADGALGVLAGWTLGSLAVRTSLDVAVPGGGLEEPRIAARRTYGTAQVGVAWSVTGGLGLHLQGAAHLSPLRGTGLGEIDSPTYYVLAGASLALPAALDLCVGVVENVFSPYRGADITFMVAVRSR